jgi:hypothetical protein
VLLTVNKTDPNGRFVVPLTHTNSGFQSGTFTYTLPRHFFGLIYCYDERVSDVPANYEKIRLTA